MNNRIMTTFERIAIHELLGLLVLRKSISLKDLEHIVDMLNTGEVKSRGTLDKID